MPPTPTTRPKTETQGGVSCRDPRPSLASPDEDTGGRASTRKETTGVEAGEERVQALQPATRPRTREPDELPAACDPSRRPGGSSEFLYARRAIVDPNPATMEGGSPVPAAGVPPLSVAPRTSGDRGKKEGVGPAVPSQPRPASDRRASCTPGNSSTLATQLDPREGSRRPVSAAAAGSRPATLVRLSTGEVDHEGSKPRRFLHVADVGESQRMGHGGGRAGGRAEKVRRQGGKPREVLVEGRCRSRSLLGVAPCTAA